MTVDPLVGTTPAFAGRGLTTAEVEDRVARGLSNQVEDRSSRSVAGILRANIFTRFNAIITGLAVVVLVFGNPIDALFVIVMVLNALIGVVQELRAKKTLDDLRVLVEPTARVVRDGTEREVPDDELVIDDLIRLRTGDQVLVDAEVVEATGLEVDESALTGESDPVAKAVDDHVLSGSAVVAGSALVVAHRVGTDTWIHGLVSEAKQFVLTQSELRVGVDRILRFIGFVLPVLGALLVWSQLEASETLADGMVAAVAGMVGLVPQGLVLLVSMAMAVAVIRLARNDVVVQELPAVEGLARVDVICLDKTGTLTTGLIVVEDIEPSGAISRDELRRGVAALAAAEPSPTATMRVVSAELGTGPGWVVRHSVPFSSDRKWSATTFGEHGTWVVGAPEIVGDAITTADLAPLRSRLDELTAGARRVLLVAAGSQELDPTEHRLPPDLSPVGLIILKEQVRPDAGSTLDYFRQQGVTVKVISGDNPATVLAIAREAGVPDADTAIDLRAVESITPEVAAHPVFGRVLPEQKRDLVEALKESGHTVAMTGDGVNDIPALKKSDIGIGMDTATPATKAVSQLVLLDGRFDRLPAVVGEGRRVIANMERVSSLFVTKTVYAMVLAIVIGVAGASFPFLPRHLSLIAAVTIGIPAFLLSFRATTEPCRPGYLRRVLHFAIPAGLTASLVTLGSFWVAQQPPIDASLEESRTIATLALGSTALWILSRLIRPIDRWEALLLTALAGSFVAVFAIPAAREFFAFELPSAIGLATVLGAAGVGVVVLEVLAVFFDRIRFLERVGIDGHDDD